MNTSMCILLVTASLYLSAVYFLCWLQSGRDTDRTSEKKERKEKKERRPKGHHERTRDRAGSSSGRRGSRVRYICKILCQDMYRICVLC